MRRYFSVIFPVAIIVVVLSLTMGYACRRDDLDRREKCHAAGGVVLLDQSGWHCALRSAPAEAPR